LKRVLKLSAPQHCHLAIFSALKKFCRKALVRKPFHFFQIIFSLLFMTSAVTKIS